MSIDELSSDLGILGQALQGVAIGMASLDERTMDFVAQTVELVLLVGMVVVGTLIVAWSMEEDESVWERTMFVLLVRADITGQLAVAIVRTATWFGKVRPAKMPYEHEIFPLQAAALMWNDGKMPDLSGTVADNRSSLVIRLSAETLRWRPFLKTENAILALIKLPFFLVISGIFYVLRGMEIVLYELVYRFLMFSYIRGLPLPNTVGRKYAFRVGTAALASKAQLDQIQSLVCLEGGQFDMAEARRVCVRALSTANLLSTAGFERLLHHAPGRLTNNELAGQLGGILKQRVNQSRVPGLLGVLKNLEVVNRHNVGEKASQTIAWGRCLVGAKRAIEAEGSRSPKGPIVASILQVSADIRSLVGDYQAHKCLWHWYTVTRRWLVDLTMSLWWDLDAKQHDMCDPRFLQQRFEQFAEQDRYNRLSLGCSISMIASAHHLTPAHAELLRKYVIGERHRPAWARAPPTSQMTGLSSEAVTASYIEGTVTELLSHFKGEGNYERRKWLKHTRHSVFVLQRAIMMRYESLCGEEGRAQHGPNWASQFMSFAGNASPASDGTDTGGIPTMKAAYRRASITSSSGATETAW